MRPASDRRGGWRGWSFVCGHGGVSVGGPTPASPVSLLTAESVAPWMSASSRRICDGPPRPAAPKSGRCNDRPYHQRGWSGHHSCTSGADTANVTPYKNSRQAHEYWSPRVPTPQPGLRPAAVALRAAQNSGLPCSSDRRAPDPSRQSADGCALWSRLETRYLRLPSPLRHNIFPPDASALWSTFGRGSALVTRCPSSLPLCFRHHQQIVGS